MKEMKKKPKYNTMFFILILIFIASFTGFGVFFVDILIGWNVFFSAFIGMSQAASTAMLLILLSKDELKKMEKDD